MMIDFRLRLTADLGRGKRQGMTTWMDCAITRLKQKDDRDREAVEKARHKEKVINDKRDEFWRNLRQRIDIDINRLNGHFRDRPDRQLYLWPSDQHPEMIMIERKEAYPLVKLQAQLCDDAIRYEYEVTITDDSPPLTGDGVLRFDIDGSDNLMIRKNGKLMAYTDVPGFLFEPVLFPDEHAT